MSKLDKKNIEDILPLTPIQEGMLFHYLKDPGSDFYFEQLSLEIAGEIDFELFEQAWNFVIETNEMLRSLFHWENTVNPVQVVLKKHKLQIEYTDFSNRHSSEKKKCMEEITRSAGRKGFNLDRVPFGIILGKTGENSYKLTLRYHHILMDGWSTGIILKEFFTHYHDLIRGRKRTKIVKRKFKDYVKWVKNQQQNKPVREIFWNDYLKGVDTPGILPIKVKPGDEQSRETRVPVGRYSLTLSKEITAELGRQVKIGNTTLAVILYTAWAMLLRKYTDSEDIIFGTTVSGRSVPLEGIENMVGLFINTIPLRVKTSPNQTIQDLGLRITKDLRSRENYESTSLAEIKKYSRLSRQEELFDNIVVIENYPLPKDISQGNSGLTIRSYSMLETSNYDLTVIISVFQGIEINLVYDNRKFTKDSVVRLSGHFKRITLEIAAFPQKEIAGIDILADEEKQELLEVFNQTNAPYPQEKTLHQVFAGQVERTPDNIAVVARQLPPSTGSSLSELISITYKELNDRSQRLAGLLKARGLQPDIIVGIMLERSVEMIMGIMGILIAGGAYLPIDPEYPGERIQYMLKDSSVKILLKKSENRNPKSRCFQTNPNDPNSNEQNKRAEVTVLDFEHLNFEFLIGRPRRGLSNFEFRASNLKSSNLAYIIYTSGSTGKPKGVMVEHTAAVNILSALQQEYPLTEIDAYLFKTSVVFDVSVTELFGWFFGGGRLVIPGKGGEKDPHEILNAIEQMGITHINFVPSLFNVFVQALNPQNRHRLSRLKYIFLAGEVLLAEVVARFKDFNKTVVLENIYGPTEGTIYSSKFSLTGWSGTGSIPIGRPLPNVRICILDKNEHLQPIGIPGELCLGGVGLARGYLNRPGLTAEKFDHDLWDYHDKKNKSFLGGPGGRFFKKAPLAAGGKLYKSGDLARWLPGGDIEFLGRIDRQVKIRGSRVELGEIENQLLKHPGVQQAVVMESMTEAGENYLCAYIVTRSPGAFGTSPAISTELKGYLAHTLPGYMIPGYVVEIEAIPFTPGGKIDRKALPGPVFTGTSQKGASYIPPRDSTEEKLAELWVEVLDREAWLKTPMPPSIGIDDHFFERGGHSLKALSLVLKIHKTLKIKLTLEQLFRAPTIRKLSELIKRIKKTSYRFIEPIEKREYYQLSYNQQKLWIIDQLEPGSSAYNIAGSMVIQGGLDLNALKQSIYSLIRRHESLRTGFKPVEGTPVQWVLSQFAVPFEMIDISSLDTETKSKKRERIWAEHMTFIFDLGKPPLFRVQPVKVEKDGYEILFCMHHIISDGWSLEILEREFRQFYEDYKNGGQPRVEPLSLQYKDFTAWQNRELANPGSREESRRFWQRIIGEGYGVLPLPRDFTPSLAGNRREGAGYRAVMEKDAAARLKSIARENNTSLFVVMFSAFNILLSYLSDQRDIFCGIPSAGREHISLQNLVGFFLNTLVMKSRIRVEENFIDYLHRLSGDTLEALRYQDYPLELVLGDLKLEFPDIPVFFNMLNMRDPRSNDAREEFPLSYQEENQEAKSDINVYITEHTGDIEISWHYRRNLFKPDTISYIAREYLKLLQGISVNPQRKIKDLNVCSRKDIEIKASQLEPAGAAGEFAKEAIKGSMVDRFEEQVGHYPRRTAVKTPQGHFTYGAINARANRVAHHIDKIIDRKKGAALLLEHDIDMIVGILAVLKAGTFYVPLDPEYPAKRLEYILRDSRVNLLITNDMNRVLAERLTREWGKENLTVNLSTLAASLTALPAGNPGVAITPADPAYILYTSGSTGAPKGVLQCHGNVLHFIRVYNNRLHIDSRDRLTLFSSYSFDAAVMDIYGALFNGAVLLPFNMKQEENPQRLLRWLQVEGVTIFHSIPTVYRYFTDLLTGDEELSGLRILVLGGEAVHPGDIEKYKRYFPETCRFINGLGPTESTVTLQYFMDKKTAVTGTVPVGYPVEETGVYLLKENDEEAAVYGEGEIVFRSKYLALGYLNQPGKTREVFTKNPLTGAGRIYRSGDLGMRLPDGAIVYRGRKDFQVKIRGYRVELGEVESILAGVEGIKSSVVVSRQLPGGENYLAAYYIAGKGKKIDEANLINTLNASLPGYMIPRVFIPCEDFPLTPTGKIDRKRLPDPYETRLLAVQRHGSAYTAPRNRVEEKLVEIWKAILGLELIGVGANFFHLGGHSLTATLLAARIFKEFQVKIPLAEIFRAPVIKDISSYIIAAAGDRYTPIKAREEKEYYPLSSGQKRLYVLQQMGADGISYNISHVFLLEGDLGPGKLAGSFTGLIRRHESLRTSFILVGEEPMQRVHDNVEFRIEDLDPQAAGTVAGSHREGPHLIKSEVFAGGPGGRFFQKESPWPPEAVIKNFIRPFDLSKASLLRVGLIELPHTPTALRGHPSQEGNEQQYLLVIDMHHIIADGMSLGIMAGDLMALYNEKTAAGLSLRYRDYSQWQQDQKESGEIKGQEGFWLKEFQGELPVLTLPADFKRQGLQDFEGGSWSFSFGEKETGQLKKLAAARDVTLFMVLLSLYNVWLARLSTREDIIVGTPVAGRRCPGIENIIGMFVNTLALRSYPVGGKAFLEFLYEVRQWTLAAFENQDYQFEDLVARLQQQRDSSRNPLFDVMFNFQYLSAARMELPGLTLTPYPYENQVSKFDLNLDVMEKKGRLVFNLQYCQQLFKKSTIERYARYFNNIVSTVLADPGIKLGGIEIISEAEKSEILNHFNDTVVKYPLDRIVKALFEEQVGKTPGEAAAVCEEEILNYRELNEIANGLTRSLRSRGIGPGTLVPVLMDHSLELLISFLSLVKIGAAFVPVDVRWPLERIKMILADLGAGIVLVDSFTPYKKTDLDKETVMVDREEGAGPGSTQNPSITVTPESPIYAMYTSGSTGKPKGVLIHQRGISNRLLWMNDYFGIDKAGVVLQTTRYVYDSVVWQFFWPLMNGGKTIILPPDFLMSAQPLAHLVEKYGITMTDFVPSVFKVIVDQLIEDPRFRGKLKSLQEVILGAEEIIPSSVYKFMEAFPGIRLTNLYGPTEATIGCIYHPVAGDEGEQIPIGRPIANVRVYILDRYMKLLPVGTAGEIFIAGVGVGHGYINEIEKTGNVFLDNPFPPGQKMYRTGDLARWTAEGRIDFLGRIDYQVKIRGVRIELAEIEQLLLTHKDVKDAVVTAWEKPNGDKYLCAYIVPFPSLALPAEKELKAYLANELPGYMMPHYFVPMDTIPLTPAGKVDRKAFPRPEPIAGVDYVAPRNQVEEKLVEIWAGVLGRESLPAPSIGIADNFFQLGGHSLKAIALVSRIHKELEVKLPITELFKNPTIASISYYIKGVKKNKYPGLTRMEKKEYYDLSFAQKRLFILDQAEGSINTAYNLPGAMLIEGQLDKERIEHSFTTLVKRHDSFRTSFAIKWGKPVQIIHDTVVFEVEYSRLAGQYPGAGILNPGKPGELSQVIKDFIKPFELDKAPLLRIVLIRTANQKHLLLIDMHHIISDGFSSRTLVQEFLQLYEGKNPPQLKFQYKDFLEWQNSRLYSEEMKKQEVFWLNRFSGDIPLLNMPTDYPRPPLKDFKGNTIAWEIDRVLSGKIKEVMEETGATLYMILLAVFNILLSRYTGQEDIIVGVPAAARSHPDLEHIVGMFVNTLAMRNYPRKELSFGDFLQEVKAQALKAFENQDYPFEELVNKLEVPKDYSRNPLFDVLFVSESLEIPGLKLKGLAFTPVEIENRISHMDLVFYIIEGIDKIKLRLEYATALFKQSSVELILKHYVEILGQAVENINIKLAEIEISHDFLVPQFNILKENQDGFGF